MFLQLACLHQQEIAGGFLTELGPTFLTRLYRALSRSPHSFVIVASKENEAAGFICGASDTGRVYRHFMLRWGLVTLPILIPKLVSLGRIRRVFETLLYPSRKENLELPTPEILNFCVSKKWQRKGVGKALFNALLEEFRKRRISRIRIVTGGEQYSAQAFYESIGASLVSEIEVHNGTKSLVYTYDIGDGEPTGPQNTTP